MSAVEETIHVAIVGCGGNGRGHLQNYLGMEGVKVVGLADPSRKARQLATELAPDSGIKTFASHTVLLRRTKPDAVVISTPHACHCQQILDSLAAGCHVLSEKPMVCSVQEAQAVIQAAQKAGRILGVSYNRHVMPPYMYCRRAIQAGEIGEVVFVSCLQSQDWLESQRGTWRQQLELSCGGQLNDSGSHLLDIVLWMTDLQPETVFAFQDNCGTEVDILMAMSVRARSGVLLNFSVVAQSVHWLEDITIWGTKGTLAIRGPEVFYWKSDQEQGKVNRRQLPRQVYPHPDFNFIAALRGEDEIAVPPECGLEVIRLSEAAWKSARTGRPAQVKY